MVHDVDDDAVSIMQVKFRAKYVALVEDRIQCLMNGGSLALLPSDLGPRSIQLTVRIRQVFVVAMAFVSVSVWNAIDTVCTSGKLVSIKLSRFVTIDIEERATVLRRRPRRNRRNCGRDTRGSCSRRQRGSR